MKKGRLIVFTGIDGSGKTTQSKLLVKSLQKDGIDVLYVWSRWEPFFLRPFIKRWKGRVGHRDGGYKAEKIKEEKTKLLSNPVFCWLWLVAFFIDYGLQIFFKIRVGLLRKKLIISDRIFYDSLIDQAINLVRGKDWLLKNLDSFWMKVFFPEPDLVIYVDCPEDIAFTRNIAKNDTQDTEYLIERRRLYLKLADRYRWFKIDGTLPVDEIAVQIKDKVYKKLDI